MMRLDEKTVAIISQFVEKIGKTYSPEDLGLITSFFATSEGMEWMEKVADDADKMLGGDNPANDQTKAFLAVREAMENSLKEKLEELKARLEESEI